MKFTSIKSIRTNMKNNNLYYYTLYSILFLFTAAVCFFWFIYNNKSLVSNADALNQHFSALGYYGKYLRGIFRTFFETGNFAIPLWDSKLGFGSDILTTLHYYVVGDPLTLLSIFVPASKTEFLYGFLIILRLYLAGFGFLLYCSSMRREPCASLCGAFVYAFSTYALYASTTHPFFANSMVYFPFLLIGIEKIFSKKKPYLFIIMVFISGISNFYLLYVLSILIFLYAVVRFFSFYKEHRVYNLLICFRTFCGYYIIGILLASILLFPNILAALSSKRFSIDTVVPQFYTEDYYKRLIFGIFSGQRVGNWTFIGCSVVTFPALILLLIQRKKYWGLKVSFFALTGFLLIPFAGHVFNTFSYASNRWTWAYCFLMAFILVTMLPKLLSITKRQFAILTGATTLYLLISFIFGKNSAGYFFKPCLLLIFAVFIILIISILNKQQKLSVLLRKKLSYTAIFSLIVSGIVFYGYDQFYTGDAFKAKGESYPLIVNEPLSALKEINDPDFFRYELMGQASDISRTNSALLNEMNGMDFYYSVADGNVTEFLFEMSGSFYLTSCFRGLDNRVILDTLSNVKYQVCDKSQNADTLFGYLPRSSSLPENSPYQIYENQYALPFGYTYGSYLSRDEYALLSPVKKQSAILQGAVLDQQSPQLKKTKTQFTDSAPPYTVKCSKNVTYQDGKFSVKKDLATVTLSFEGIPASENYLTFSNLQFQETKKKPTKEPISSVVISANANEQNQNFKVLTPYDRWYEDKKDYLVNFCYNKDALNTITITFNTKGIYSFDEMNIVCQPMDSYISQVTNLKRNYLKNTVFSANKISGSIEVDSSKLLCLNIPYSKGWNAYVDGQKTEILRTNTISSGIMINEGSHIIELRYFTPGLRISILCFFLGIMALISVILHEKSKSKKV